MRLAALSEAKVSVLVYGAISKRNSAGTRRWRAMIFVGRVSRQS